MIQFKPKDMEESQFLKLIEDKGVENEDLQIYTKIKELISFRYTVATNIDCAVLVSVGIFIGLGWANHNPYLYILSALMVVISSLLKLYTNQLFEDYEEANILIQDTVNGIAYEIGQSKS